MRRVIAAALSISSLLFPSSATAGVVANPQPQVQQVQVTREDLIVVAARALEDRKYKLACE